MDLASLRPIGHRREQIPGNPNDLTFQDPRGTLFEQQPPAAPVR